MLQGKVAVLGGGAMGTACALLLAEGGRQEVALWVRDPRHAADIDRERENRRLLPGVSIPPEIPITSDVAAAVRGSELLVLAIPTKFLRAALESLASVLNENRPVVSVVKGIENDTLLRPSEIIEDVLGQRAVVSLSGPSHAEEISRRLPASVVAASGDLALARSVQQRFSTDRFRVYTNPDIVGVELAGALKNVVAIAAGISDGLGYGDNAKSALMTRGLVEMTRFGVRLGAEPTTFAGLAGMGDLIATCCSRHSRNRKVGELLGQGKSLDEILSSMEAVAEGVSTARSVYDLAEQTGIDMPITTEVFQVMFEGKSPAEATDSLMLRPPREE